MRGRRAQRLAHSPQRTRSAHASDRRQLWSRRRRRRRTHAQRHRETTASMRHSGTYVDLTRDGDHRSTKVVRVALENAVSAASVLLLTEATMTDIPERLASKAPLLRARGAHYGARSEYRRRACTSAMGAAEADERARGRGRERRRLCGRSRRNAPGPFQGRRRRGSGSLFAPRTPWYLVGRKAMARALSDVAAMGGIPTFAVVALIIRRSMSMADVKAVERGLEHFGVPIVGGDTKSHDGPCIVSVSLLGECAVQSPCCGEGHDLVTSYSSPASSAVRSAADLKFQPRLEEGRLFATEIARACTR